MGIPLHNASQFPRRMWVGIFHEERSDGPRISPHRQTKLYISFIFNSGQQIASVDVPFSPAQPVQQGCPVTCWLLRSATLARSGSVLRKGLCSWGSCLFRTPDLLVKCSK